MEKSIILKKGKWLAFAYFFGVSTLIYLSYLVFDFLFSDYAFISTLQNFQSLFIGIITAGLIYWLIKETDQEIKTHKERVSDLLEKEKNLRNKSDQVREKLIYMLRKAPAPMAILLGSGHRFDFVNDAFVKMFGHKKYVDNNLRHVIPELKEQGIEIFDKVYETGKPHFDKGVPLNLSSNGNPKTYYHDFIITPLTDPAGEVYGTFLLSNNITEQVEAKKALEETLEEKQILLSELHHRVKNNLAVVVGLLELQTDDIEDSRALTALKKSQTRIHTIAEVHEILYGNQSLQEIPFHDFIHGLIKRIFDSFDKSRPELHLFVNNLSLNVNQAIPIGLILNELFSCLAKDFDQSVNKLKIQSDLSNSPDISISIKIYPANLQFIEALTPSEKRLERILIDLLLQQLDAEFITSHSSKSSEVLIKFTTKNDEKGGHGNVGEEFILRSLLSNGTQVA